jgi:hypothetical protein
VYASMIRAPERGLTHLSSDKSPKFDVQNDGHHADHVTGTDGRKHIRSSVAASQIVAPQPFTFVNGEVFVLHWLASGESLRFGLEGLFAPVGSTAPAWPTDRAGARPDHPNQTKRNASFADQIGGVAEGGRRWFVACS